MEEFIILYKSDLEALQKDEPVLVYIDDVPFTICTAKYFKNQFSADKHDGVTMHFDEVVSKIAKET